MAIIKLQCGTCENSTCCYSKKYIPYDSLEGCTRKVDEDLEIEYYHMINEVAPFMYMKTTKEYQNKTYKEIIGLLDKVYSSPIGVKLDKHSKVKTELPDE